MVGYGDSTCISALTFSSGIYARATNTRFSGFNVVWRFFVSCSAIMPVVIRLQNISPFFAFTHSFDSFSGKKKSQIMVIKSEDFTNTQINNQTDKLSTNC